MTNKLTKNDSVKNSCSDLNKKNMQDPIQLQELREQFEAILYKHDLWYDYYFWFATQHGNRGREEIFTQWKQWTQETYPEYWVSQAFLFEKTDRLPMQWVAVDNLWRVWLVKNNL